MDLQNIQKFYTHYSEKIKWLFIIISTIMIVIGNIYFYNFTNIFLKILFNSILSILNITIFFFTKFFKKNIKIFHETKNEIRNITWPNKKETFKITIVILFIILITSSVLWVLDNMCLRIISFLIQIRP
ncbi:preprotein translocase subunit SecE [Buchnera aphidicola]|uniref:Protein translocase subunit SecE n=1 Tax=Buchnera aphidicola subsp. Tuberolachnus salignus TaxID=98804 RepID=A0A160SX27_BUCTT|nr:preprotein translocase subunit SecE [Buchnera aphidicola]CUR53015.1 Protein translocase subunit SecE [Buchnera aphidicola (Tuberolachnus salignus)]